MYNAHWIHSLPYSKFIELTLISIFAIKYRKMEENIKKKIREELESYGLTEKDLSSEELKALEDEIKAKEDGYMILDGVLSDPEILMRSYRKEQ